MRHKILTSTENVGTWINVVTLAMAVLVKWLKEWVLVNATKQQKLMMSAIRLADLHLTLYRSTLAQLSRKVGLMEEQSPILKMRRWEVNSIVKQQILQNACSLLLERTNKQETLRLTLIPNKP